MMQPLVSILIPCYNADRWLAETIESALAQTWENKEIIIVDDGSTDGSLAIAQRFESPQVKVIHQENQGQSASENRALQEAQGDFIQYLDADDLLALDKIERQVMLLGDGNSEFVAAGEWARFCKSPQEAIFTPEAVWETMPSVDWLVCSWEGGGMMHGAAWLIPRNIVERAGGWNKDLSLINDFDYFCRVLLASQGVEFCWGAKSYYRSGLANSLSGAKSRRAFESAFQSTELGVKHLLTVENSQRTRHACATAWQRLVYSTYPKAIDLVTQAEANIKQLGGTRLPCDGGPRFQRVAQLMGWKAAKRVQFFYSS
jgi:glycosyltransferase involved in cell wall biosynthesis